MQLSLGGCAAPVYFALSLNSGAVNFRRASPESDVLFDGYGARKEILPQCGLLARQTVSPKLSSLPAGRLLISFGLFRSNIEIHSR
jgi:hypothetical protein